VGDPIVIEAGEGRVELRSAERIPTLEELVSRITKTSRYEETESGPDKGKEFVEWQGCMCPAQETSYGWILIRRLAADKAGAVRHWC